MARAARAVGAIRAIAGGIGARRRVGQGIIASGIATSRSTARGV
jgi:hypothetical protein